MTNPTPHGQAPAGVLHLVQDAFAEIAMAFPKAFALHKVGIADTAVREALAATQQAGDLARLLKEILADACHYESETNLRAELYQRLYDAHAALTATPQPTHAQAVNQADRPFIVRLAEDFAEECVTAGYVTTKAASYGRLMDEALSTQAQAGAVPLTDEQLAEMMRETWGCASIAPRHAMKFARAIEADHGIGIKGGQHGAE